MLTDQEKMQTPTTRQGTVLQTLAVATGTGKMTAKQIGVRSDVLWRMEERGWVARTMWDAWYIHEAGREALERYRDHLGI